jgi:serine/threonine protein kinase
MLDDIVRKNLGRYSIIKKLGGGGMGAVFKGRDVTLNRDVAIKVMHPHIASRPNFRERFLQEARVAAHLDHPSIVQVYDFGQDNNLLYIVMKFIAGPNLEGMLRDMRAQKKWIDLSEAVELVRQVSLALNYAHEQDVLHRDIKPANIMIEPVRSGKLAYRPVLTDLGLAKLTQGGVVTEDGVSMGTPTYMSPEQALGKETDRRSDVYSLGVLLFELATGRPPFPIKSLTEAIRYHTQEQPPSPRSIRPDIPESLEQVILKAMAKNPDDRYPTAEAFAEALESTFENFTQAKTGPTEMAGGESLITQYQKSIVDERGQSLMDEFAQPSSFSQDRIQVLGPDKRTTSAPVKHPSMTIGRSAENDLVLNDNKVSRQHARVEYDNGTYKVTDLNSSNGTFLANTRLLPGVSEAWMPNQALRLGDHWLRIVRAQTESTIGGGMPRQTYTSDQFQVSMGSQVGIFLEDKQLSVEPGGTLTTPVVVLNQSNLVDHFRVHLEGVPERWVKISPEDVPLMPGEQAPVNVTVQPPRSSSSRAGRYPITLKVTSKEFPNQVAEEQATLTLGVYSQFTSEMQPQKLRAGQTAQITVTNNGNTHDTYTLTHSDRGEELAFTPPKSQLRVPEGKSAAAQFKVQSRQRRLIGGEKTYAFTSQVTAAGGETKMHSGEVAARAILPPWIIPAVLALFACLAISGVLIYSGITNRTKNAQATADAQKTAIAMNVLNANQTQTAAALAITNDSQSTSQAATATNQVGAQQTEQAAQATQQAATQTAGAQTQTVQDIALAQTQTAQAATQTAQANDATQQAAQQTAAAQTQIAQAQTQTAEAQIQTAAAQTQIAQAQTETAQAIIALTQTAEASKPKVAYIYSDDSGTANQFKDLFENNGYRVDLVHQNDVMGVDFSNYRFVLIGHETGRRSDWKNNPWGDSAEQQAQHIFASGKPVIGLGFGGSLYFQAVGLYINWGQSAINLNGSTQAIPDNTNDNLWKSPNSVSISGGAATLYSGNSGYVEVYIPDPVNGVDTLARPPGDSKYAVIALEKSKYMLWGFEGGPNAMTSNGKAAMINAARRILPIFIFPKITVIPLPTSIIIQP